MLTGNHDKEIWYDEDDHVFPADLCIVLISPSNSFREKTSFDHSLMQKVEPHIPTRRMIPWPPPSGVQVQALSSLLCSTGSSQDPSQIERFHPYLVLTTFRKIVTLEIWIPECSWMLLSESLKFFLSVCEQFQQASLSRYSRSPVLCYFKLRVATFWLPNRSLLESWRRARSPRWAGFICIPIALQLCLSWFLSFIVTLINSDRRYQICNFERAIKSFKLPVLKIFFVLWQNKKYFR